MDGDERLSKVDYKNWLKVIHSLYLLKQGLGSWSSDVVADFQKRILVKNGIVGKCDNVTCDAKHIKQNQLLCPNDICNKLLVDIVEQHENKKMVEWKNADVKQWPVNSWEIAKVYMGRGQQLTNIGPESTDCSGILQLISKCKLFRKCGVMPNDVNEIIRIRNQMMHSADLSVDDESTSAMLKSMITFLEQVAKKVGEQNRNDVTLAIQKIGKVKEADINIDVECSCLKEKMTETENEFKYGNTDETAVKTSEGAMEIVEFVYRYPELHERLADEWLSLLQCLKATVTRSIQTEQRVNLTEKQIDDLNKRVEILEKKEASKPRKADCKGMLQAYAQGKSLPLPKYDFTPAFLSESESGFKASVEFNGKTFNSTRGYKRKVDAEQDAAEQALRELSRDICQSNGAATSEVDKTVGQMAEDLQLCLIEQTTQSLCSSCVTPSVMKLTKDPPSYFDLLAWICQQNGIDPPKLTLTQANGNYKASLSVRFKFCSGDTKMSKKQVEEMAAQAAVSVLTVGNNFGDGSKTFKSLLNEFCQKQGIARGFPEYSTVPPGNAGPFTGYVFVPVVRESEGSDEGVARNLACRTLINDLKLMPFVQKLYDTESLKNFTLSISSSEDKHSFDLIADYQFDLEEGCRSKKDAEKKVAQIVVRQLRPSIDASNLNTCKNALQELFNASDRPEYKTVERDHLFYSSVAVKYRHTAHSDICNPVEAIESFASQVSQQITIR